MCKISISQSYINRRLKDPFDIKLRMISKSFLVLTLALFCRANAQVSLAAGYGPYLDTAAQYGAGFGYGPMPGFQLGAGGRGPYVAAVDFATDFSRIPAKAAAALFDSASHLAGDLSEMPSYANAMMTGGMPGYGVSANMGMDRRPSLSSLMGALGSIGRPLASLASGGRPAAALQGLASLASNLGLGGRPAAALQGLASYASHLNEGKGGSNGKNSAGIEVEVGSPSDAADVPVTLEASLE